MKYVRMVSDSNTGCVRRERLYNFGSEVQQEE